MASPANQKYKRRPPVPVMVDNALKTVGGRKGCGLQKIKKVIADEYSLSKSIYNRKINLYVVQSLENGHFIRKSGIGLNGTFKIAKPDKTSKSDQKKTMLGKENQSKKANTMEMTEKKKKAVKEAAAARETGVVKSRK